MEANKFFLEGESPTLILMQLQDFKGIKLRGGMKNCLFPLPKKLADN